MPTEELVLRMSVHGGRLVAEEVGGAEQAVGKYERAASRAHESTTRLSGAFGTLRSAVFTAAGITGLTGLGIGLGEAVKNAQAFQDQQAQLRASLQANHVTTRNATGALSDYADSLALHGGFAPPEQLQGLTQLIRTTHSVAGAEKDLALATNIARGAHRDLSLSVRAVQMAQGGHLALLTRLGIVLPKHATAIQAMTILQQRYAGATEAFNHTAAGGMNDFRNALDILGERVGALLIPALTTAFRWLGNFVDELIRGVGPGHTVRVILHDIGDAFQRIYAAGKSVVDFFKGWIGDLNSAHPRLVAMTVGIGVAAAAFAAWRIGIMAWTVATRVATAAQVLFTAVMDASPIMLVVTAIAALAAAFTYAYEKSPAFRHAVQDVLSVIGSLPGKIAHIGVAIGNAIKTGMLAAINFVIDRINNLIDVWNALPFTTDIAHLHHLGDPKAAGPPNQRTHPGVGTTSQRSFLNTPLHPVASSPTAHNHAGDIVVHAPIYLDGQQMGRALTRVGKNALALR